MFLSPPLKIMWPPQFRRKKNLKKQMPPILAFMCKSYTSIRIGFVH